MRLLTRVLGSLVQGFKYVLPGLDGHLMNHKPKSPLAKSARTSGVIVIGLSVGTHTVKNEQTALLHLSWVTDLASRGCS